MGEKVYALKMPAESFLAEPAGDLLQGWLPGTAVKFSETKPRFSKNTVCCVERSDGKGGQAGFLLYAPQHLDALGSSTSQWAIDTKVLAGGSFESDLTSRDPGASLVFNRDDKTVDKMGTFGTTFVIWAAGIFKFYVFEKQNKAKRNTGTGEDLTYSLGCDLYVSSRGFLTSECEDGTSAGIPITVAGKGTDEEGDFIIVVPFM